MNEPTYSAFAITGAVAALLGPVLGPLALLLFASVMGGLLAMGRVSTMTRWEGVRFVAVGVGISLVLTGFAVWAVETYTTIPGNIALMPLAFGIAAARTSILELIDTLVASAARFLTTLGGKGAD